MLRRQAPLPAPHAATRRAATALAAAAVAALVATSAPSAPPAHARPSAQAGECFPTLVQRLDRQRVDLGESVGVQVDMDPGCGGGGRLTRHHMIVLQPWADAAGAAAARDLAVDFAGHTAAPSLVGAIPGHDPLIGIVAPVGSSRTAVDGALRAFQPTANGATLADLVRAAYNRYADAANGTGAPAISIGRRSIVVIGHAGAPVGFVPQIVFDVKVAKSFAIDVVHVCIGGGCERFDGIETVDVPDAAAAIAALRDFHARPAPVGLEWATVRAFMGNQVAYTFASASPRPDRIGRLGTAYVEWRLTAPVAAQALKYRASATLPGSIRITGSALLEGVTTAGDPVNYSAGTLPAITVNPVPPKPSDCDMRALTEAAPDPVALGAEATVTMTLVADCPPTGRDLDVVLAIDRSASMLQGKRLADVRTAARAFIQGVDLARTRVAIVTFASTVERAADLTADRASLLAALDGVAAGGETYMAQGIAGAREILEQRRPDAVPVIVLLSDGEVRDDPQPEADWAHLEGIRFVAVCVNKPEVCGGRFRSLASPSSYYLATTDTATLARFYADLGAYLGQPGLDQLTVNFASLPMLPYTSLARDHDRPSAIVDGVLTWDQAAPLFGRTRLVFPLAAAGPGRWPVAERIEAVWRDSFGGIGTASLNVPELTVKPPEEGPCAAERLDRVVDPGRVAVGATVSTTVRVDIACRGTPLPVEIALVVDHSGSMRGQRIEDTRKAVEALLAETASADARFGLVAFSNFLLARVALTADRDAIRSELGKLNAEGGTNVGMAIRTATGLFDDARPGARRFIVLLTDGYTDGEPIPTAAGLAKDAGIELIAICAGSVCDAALRTAVSHPSFYFDVADTGGLVELYRRIASALSGLVPTHLIVRDQTLDAGILGAVDDSAIPPPNEGPDPDLWAYVFPPPNGISINRRLEARRPGHYPATLWTRVEYETTDGLTGVLYVPPAPVTIVGPGPEPAALPTAGPLPSPSATPTASGTPTEAPTSTSTATPTATLTPNERGIYLPLVARDVRADELPTAVVPSATPTPTETSTPTVTPTPSATPIPLPTRTPGPTRTATATWTPRPTATPFPTAGPRVVIQSMACRSDDEVVMIGNNGGSSAQLAGWRLRTLPGRATFIFPAYTLDPGNSVFVHSGPDAPPTQGDRIRWTTERRWADADGGELMNRQGVKEDEGGC